MSDEAAGVKGALHRMTQLDENGDFRGNLADDPAWRSLVRSAEMAPTAAIVRTLAQYAESRAAKVRRATGEQIARAMSGVGHHRDPCRLPDTPCLCGVCDFRAEASQVAREVTL